MPQKDLYLEDNAIHLEKRRGLWEYFYQFCMKHILEWKPYADLSWVDFIRKIICKNLIASAFQRQTCQLRTQTLIDLQFEMIAFIHQSIEHLNFWHRHHRLSWYYLFTIRYQGKKKNTSGDGEGKCWITFYWAVTRLRAPGRILCHVTMVCYVMVDVCVMFGTIKCCYYFKMSVFLRKSKHI